MDLTGHGLHIRHDLAQSGGAGGLVKAGGVGGHLTEELVLGLVSLRELGTLVPLRGHAANAEVGVPRLVAGLVLLGVLCPGIQHPVHGHLCGGACLAPARLVHQEDTVPAAQEHGVPALPAVGGGHPAHAGLAVAVEKHHGQAGAFRRNLVENIGMAHMGGVAGPGGVQPVRGGVIVPRHGLSDGSAGGEHSLFGNHQRAVRNFIRYFTLRPLGNRGGRAVIGGRASAACQQGERQYAACNHRGPSEFVFHQNFLLL